MCVVLLSVSSSRTDSRLLARCGLPQATLPRTRTGGSRAQTKQAPRATRVAARKENPHGWPLAGWYNGRTPDARTRINIYVIMKREPLRPHFCPQIRSSVPITHTTRHGGGHSPRHVSVSQLSGTSLTERFQNRAQALARQWDADTPHAMSWGLQVARLQKLLTHWILPGPAAHLLSGCHGTSLTKLIS